MFGLWLLDFVISLLVLRLCLRCGGGFCVVFVFGMVFRCLDAGLTLVGCGSCGVCLLVSLVLLVIGLVVSGYACCLWV